MRRKVLATLAMGALAFGTMGFNPTGNGNGNGNGGPPGPFGPNNFGLCTAWEANENGRANGRADEAPPFRALQDAADAAGQTVGEWCDANSEHPGGGGNRQGPPNGG